ncbi:hypothetical protein GCM10009765_08480 [Fodinicola feengrottensis]|uniref:Molybdopterin-dependent oxidoreductase n=1 Tax=Fodinicola feengrottensis TaxID=435914 RepID=A0ABN2FY49_9ACTN
MRTIRFLALSAAAVATAAALSSAAAPTAAAPATPAHQWCKGGAVISGNVSRPGCASAASLAKLAQKTVTVTFSSSAGNQTHTFSGPLLLDVITAAKPRFPSTVKNVQLRYAVLATGSDDYQATVAWGEFDPKFAGKQILVATKQDGVALAMPRLVVPGDTAGGRYVSDVVSLRLGRPFL